MATANKQAATIKAIEIVTMLAHTFNSAEQFTQRWSLRQKPRTKLSTIFRSFADD